MTQNKASYLDKEKSLKWDSVTFGEQKPPWPQKAITVNGKTVAE